MSHFEEFPPALLSPVWSLIEWLRAGHVADFICPQRLQNIEPRWRCFSLSHERPPLLRFVV